MNTDTLPDPYQIDALALRDAAEEARRLPGVLQAAVYEPDPDIDGGHPSLSVIIHAGCETAPEVETVNEAMRALGLCGLGANTVNQGVQRFYAFPSHPEA